MSVLSLRERVAKKLLEQTAPHYSVLSNLRYHAGDGDKIPPVTMEQIAMQALEAAATIRALSKAHEILDEEFKALTAPKEPKQEVERDEQEADGESLYG